MGRARRLFAAGSLLAAAGGFAWIAFEHASWSIEWPALAFGAGLAAASVGIVRKNIYAQVLSRGLAWVLFAPCALVMTIEALNGRLHEPAVTAFGVASGLSLFLARPMLDTAEARAAFAPTKFRRSFLAACTATVAGGLVTGMVAWEALWHSHSPFIGVGLAALGTSMIASAFGVLRMRGWGIALAVVNAIVSLVAGAATGHSEGVALAATALPAVLFLWPIVLAKLGVGEQAGARVRIAEEAALPARVRVATTNDEDLELAEADEPAQTQLARKTTDVPELTRGISFT